jgi:hypothetical protein
LDAVTIKILPDVVTEGNLVIGEAKIHAWVVVAHSEDYGR